jgi:hypothetical protein
MLPRLRIRIGYDQFSRFPHWAAGQCLRDNACSVPSSGVVQLPLPARAPDPSVVPFEPWLAPPPPCGSWPLPPAPSYATPPLPAPLPWMPPYIFGVETPEAPFGPSDATPAYAPDAPSDAAPAYAPDAPSDATPAYAPDAPPSWSEDVFPSGPLTEVVGPSAPSEAPTWSEDVFPVGGSEVVGPAAPSEAPSGRVLTAPAGAPPSDLAALNVTIWGGGLVVLASAGASAYHGYKRNHDSVGWGLAWGLLGAAVPVVTPVAAAILQGYAKPA